VPEVVAAVTRPVAGGFHHGLVSRELSGARDLVAVLRQTKGAERSAAITASARAVAALHAAGVDHVDLNLKNVLIDADGTGVVIDLDRCRIGEPDAATAERNLLRLLRSWTKLQTAEPASVQLLDPIRFVRAYVSGDRTRLRRLVTLGRATPFRLNRMRWALFPPRFP
ncbi:MAG: phosphotransferase, partial [Planctomycetes bacterium]|nr:phosphotransferase [Planctomycetota bacterium]